MTRINIVNPKDLTDQHLMAEYREITMVPAALRRSLRTRKKEDILKGIPARYTLNKGHVTFFYDKLLFLKKRYTELQDELKKRGYKLNPHRGFITFDLPDEFKNDYTPDMEAYNISVRRINERIMQKPGWYRTTEYEA